MNVATTRRKSLIPMYVAIGDSRTVGRTTDSYVNTLIADYVGKKTFINRAVNGYRATGMIDFQLIQACGVLRWFFRTSRYPWLSSGTSIAIVNETLEMTRTTAGYMYLGCLSAGQEVTISGYYTSANTTRIRIATENGGDILLATTTGDFSVNYTPTANEEQVRIGTTSGLGGDLIYIRDIKIELTDKSSVATEGVISQVGVNDLLNSQTAETVIAAIQLCIDMCDHAGIPYIHMDILPFGNEATFASYMEGFRRQVNAWMRTTGRPVIETGFLATGDVIRSEYDYGDGLHCNALGYFEMAKQVEKYLWGTAAYRERDNQIYSEPGEFRATARATQLSSISQGSTFDLVFDLNGADIWPVLAGETYYTNIELIGVTNDRDPVEGHMDLWTGSIVFSRSTLDNLTVLVPTGGTITRVTGSGSRLADAVAVTDDGSGNMQLEVTIDTVANANWVGILKGLYITGDRVGSS